ncbi:MAG: bacteriohemerythrin [Dissulfurispiraceae bacterium]|jgi:hemerythrin
MAFIEWDGSLSVGVTELDDQHKKLIGIINQLNEAMKVGKGKDVMGKTIASLIEYTKYHFGAEEKILQANAYPSLIIHKKAHESLTGQVVDLQKNFGAGSLIISIEVMNFLKDWISKHIMSTDKQYSPFLKGKGVK